MDHHQCVDHTIDRRLPGKAPPIPSWVAWPTTSSTAMIPPTTTRLAYHRRNNDGVRGKQLHSRRRRRQFTAAACRGAFTFGVTVTRTKGPRLRLPQKERAGRPLEVKLGVIIKQVGKYVCRQAGVQRSGRHRKWWDQEAETGIDDWGCVIYHCNDG